MKLESFPLNKADEKALYSSVLAKLPAGYIRDILTDCKLEIERAIDSDFGFILIADRMREIQEDRIKILNAENQLAGLKENIAELERTKVQLEKGIGQVREQIRTLARY